MQREYDELKGHENMDHIKQITALKLVSFILLIAIGGDLNAEEAGKFWLECSGPKFSQKFEFNTENETIRIVGYNTFLSIAYWSDDSINTSFPGSKSISDFVAGAKQSAETGFNFDRLTGTLSVGGVNQPTADEVTKCGDHLWCKDGLVVDLYEFNCSEIRPKF